MIRSWPRDTRTLNPAHWGDEISAARRRAFSVTGNTQSAGGVVHVQANGWGGAPSPAVGSLWESRSPPDLNYTAMAWSPQLGIFCAQGNSVAATSPDGVTWASATNNASATTMCWSPELRIFCIIQSNAVVRTSPDGVTWTVRTAAATNTWQSLCWSPELGLFCAVSNSGTGNRVMTSPDGVTWTAQTSAADNSWTSVCWSPERHLFCAGATSGTGNLIMTSPDGVTWTGQAHASGTTANKVCWSPDLGLFLYVGTGSGISSDGINWRSTGFGAGNNPTEVIWVRELGRFYVSALSGGVVYSTPDGFSWTQHPAAGVQDWNTLCWSPELKMLCAAADTGTGNRIMTSSDFVLMP